MSDRIKELAEEGLDYFDAVGDEGDKAYVAAIRELLNRRPHPAQVGVRVPDGIRRFVQSLIDKPLRGNDPEIIYAIHTGTEYAAELRMSDLVTLLSPQPGAVVGDEVVANFVEEVAKIISGAPFPSGRSMTKAREISDLALRTLTNTDKGAV